MSLLKRILKYDTGVETRYSNWLAQVAGLTLTKNLYAILGRGSSKTTDFLAERVQELVYDLPGAPVALVSDTYVNLQKNVLPTLIEGLELKGWREGIHFVIEKEPPEHFGKPYNRILSYKHTIVFFNGFNLTLISLDRPSAAAGRSYVHIIGDEVKFFPESKIAKLTKAVRGFRVKYGDSPFYRGHTFTTDMPNPNLLGEHDWVLKQFKKMDKKQLLDILQVAFVLNEIRQEYVVALNSENRKAIENVKKKMDRWEKRYRKIRKNSTFFWIASSFVNADILTEQFFEDEFDSDLEDINCAILSLLPKLEAGEKFYANLADVHFYDDGNDSYWSEEFGIRDEPDSRILKYCDPDAVLEAGLDVGNQMSLILAQPKKKGKEYRILKDIHTLSPEWIETLAKKTRTYFKHHNNKQIDLYYDRAANNYKDAGQDLASKFKDAMEKVEGRRTGWKVNLKSVGQANINSWVEYDFMMELLSGTNKKLPKLLIDRFNCRFLKSSLELAPTKKDRKGRTVKDKRSEGLPIKRLPLESTNFSDAFKYLMCRKKWLRLVKSTRQSNVGDVGAHG
jgi:hypothetical protein